MAGNERAVWRGRSGSPMTQVMGDVAAGHEEVLVCRQRFFIEVGGGRDGMVTCFGGRTFVVADFRAWWVRCCI